MWQARPVTEPSDNDAFHAALTQEAGKKSGVCWLRYDGVDHAVWHVWLEDALYVVSGGGEQPLPDIEDVETLDVVMRNKDTGQRLITWVGSVSVVHPDDERWEPVTNALVSGRLNLASLETAADEWARSSVVIRIVPTSEVREVRDSLPDDAHLAAPRTTPATTRGPLPKVFHRRARRRPRLS